MTTHNRENEIPNSMANMQLSSPQKLNYISKYFDLINNMDNQDYMLFRGQSDSSWPLTSTAFRRLSINRDPSLIDKGIFIEYNKDLIEKAKLNGYNKKESRTLTDLELLAEIQHYEGATCLIDFTKNFLVALWFAAVIPVENDKEKDVDGKVFIIQYQKNNDRYQRVISNDLNENIDSILKFETRKREQTTNQLPSNPTLQGLKYWIWEPEGMNNRILQQDSVFIFGKPNIDIEDYFEIVINKNHKKAIQDDLAAFFNISSDTLFKDLPGFSSKVNSVKNRWFSNDPNDNKRVASNIFSRGNDLHDEQNYEKALKEYNYAIKLYPNDEEFFVMRGKALFELERYQESIEDYQKAISINKETAINWDIYFLLGNIYLNLKKLDQAEEYFKMSLDLIPDGYYSKLGFGYIHYEKGEFLKAIDYYKDCLKICESSSTGQIHALIGEAEGRLGNYDRMILEYRQTFANDFTELNINMNALEASLIGGNKEAFVKIQNALKKNQKRIIYPFIFKLISIIGDIVYFNQNVNSGKLLKEIENEIKLTTEKIEWSFEEIIHWSLLDENILPDKKTLIHHMLEQTKKLVAEST